MGVLGGGSDLPCGSVKCVAAALFLTGPLIAITVQQVCTTKCMLLNRMLPALSSDMDDLLLIVLFLFFVAFNIVMGGVVWAVFRVVTCMIHGRPWRPQLANFMGSRSHSKAAMAYCAPRRLKRSKTSRVVGYRLAKCVIPECEVYICDYCNRKCGSKIGLYSHQMHCRRRPKNCMPCYGN